MPVCAKTIFEKVVEDLYTLKEARRLVTRPLNIVFRWAEWVKPDLPVSVHRMWDVNKEVNTLLVLRGVRKKLDGLNRHIKKFPEVSSVSEAVDVGAQCFINGVGLVSNGNMILNTLKRWKMISVPEKASKILSGIGLVNEMVSEGCDAIKEIRVIANSKICFLGLGEEKDASEGQKMTLSQIRLIASVISVASAALGMTCLLTVFCIKSWILLILSTFSRACSLSAYFYEQSCTFEPAQL